MLANYHTHSAFCDGEMMPEDYVLAAVRKGFSAIGFTSHAPVPFGTDWTMKPENLDKYIENINDLKKKYKNQIQIYTGLETDFYPGSADFRNHPGVDFTIGSVHFIHDQKNGRYLSVDGPVDEYRELISNVFDGNVEAFVETYYNLVGEMIKKQPPDIVGHLDLIKKNNVDNLFSESDKWYRDKVEEVLTVIREHNVIVEINTGGISRGYIKDLYPSEWILKLIREMDIPVILSSDAHRPDLVDAYYAEAVKILKSIGFTHQRVLLDSRWQNVLL
ncbi:histidinol-phosphatase HisJ [Thermoclostridium stercorarium]|jgi:histidinol-phosphatase (PHP family)|uniref:Histidinol-phosphatase n=1 Tax=Thermoclostridium stercorarium subsp. leptospartum DSM 9219 TaxID=1346611 RepID=A0A1B1YIL9_THEST|nr:histidinol-phosphatase HisJ [Thermoclostridium stercorarium]ANX00608.1 histidinol phosphatase [Thermoclostridium stercorarium subsp. leptospartum DSM 9219]UZQ86218.1 histidinol-phosphatase HisJ [Thermoclostridium stercorarium]